MKQATWTKRRQHLKANQFDNNLNNYPKIIFQNTGKRGINVKRHYESQQSNVIGNKATDKMRIMPADKIFVAAFVTDKVTVDGNNVGNN